MQECCCITYFTIQRIYHDIKATDLHYYGYRYNSVEGFLVSAAMHMHAYYEQLGKFEAALLDLTRQRYHFYVAQSQTVLIAERSASQARERKQNQSVESFVDCRVYA